MAPLARIPTVPLQRAIWSRTDLATCKLTPFNKALAHALYRANFISWFTESGHHAPDASVLKQFSPEELMKMHIAYTANMHKRQLWMGLKYHSQEWKRENGWWEDKKLPVMKTILSKSQKERSEKLILSPDQVRAFVRGEPLDGKEVDMWRKGLAEGQGVFLRVGEEGDMESSGSRNVQVLESREAAEKGLGGTVVCRVWPFRKRVEKDSEESSEAELEGKDDQAAAVEVDAEAEGVKSER